MSCTVTELNVYMANDGWNRGNTPALPTVPDCGDLAAFGRDAERHPFSVVPRRAPPYCTASASRHAAGRRYARREWDEYSGSPGDDAEFTDM